MFRWYAPFSDTATCTTLTCPRPSLVRFRMGEQLDHRLGRCFTDLGMDTAGSKMKTASEFPGICSADLYKHQTIGFLGFFHQPKKNYVMKHTVF